jgi:hypothetical protein
MAAIPSMARATRRRARWAVTMASYPPSLRLAVLAAPLKADRSVRQIRHNLQGAAEFLSEALAAQVFIQVANGQDAAHGPRKVTSFSSSKARAETVQAISPQGAGDGGVNEGSSCEAGSYQRVNCVHRSLRRPAITAGKSPDPEVNGAQANGCNLMGR